MKTLIFNGSPRIHGDTATLVGVLCKDLAGEHRIVNAYRCDISPCVDCRFCWENEGCAIWDEMQEVYQYIEDCDNILIASPIYFSELTGKLLDVASRLQTYYCGRVFRRTEPAIRPKKGAILLVGGGDGKPDRALATAHMLLRHMNCDRIYPPVMSLHTNERPAVSDEECLRGLDGIRDFFR